MNQDGGLHRDVSQDRLFNNQLDLGALGPPLHTPVQLVTVSMGTTTRDKCKNDGAKCRGPTRDPLSILKVAGPQFKGAFSRRRRRKLIRCNPSPLPPYS